MQGQVTKEKPFKVTEPQPLIWTVTACRIIDLRQWQRRRQGKYHFKINICQVLTIYVAIPSCLVFHNECAKTRLVCGVGFNTGSFTFTVVSWSFHRNLKWKTIRTNIDINHHRQIIRSFSNDESNDKEEVTSIKKFGDLWLFCDYAILLAFYNVAKVNLN